MSALSEAACRGSHDLFDSTDRRDYVVAREICGTCPAILACGQLVKDIQNGTTYLSEHGGGLAGTWAGQLWGSRSGRAREVA